MKARGPTVCTTSLTSSARRKKQRSSAISAPFPWRRSSSASTKASGAWCFYDFTHQRLEAAEELPAWLVPLAGRVGRFAALPSGSIKHALCTEYDVGAGIGWHRDKKDFDQVFGLSLASACKFRFRRKAGNKWQRFTLNAQPRSLYAMTGASRHVWEHSIPPVESQRYSITFRTMAQA